MRKIYPGYAELVFYNKRNTRERSTHGQFMQTNHGDAEQSTGKLNQDSNESGKRSKAETLRPTKGIKYSTAGSELKVGPRMNSLK